MTGTRDPFEVVIVFAVYVADEPGPIDDDEGVCSSCVALFGDAEDAIAEARSRLLEARSVSIEIGLMTSAEWDALEEVPDDFSFSRATSTTVIDPSAEGLP